MKKDYYDILGLPKGSGISEIKKAYRSLALKHHPDRVPEAEKKQAEEKFKEISEASGVISDPQKKQLYDQHGHQGVDSNYTAEDIFRGADFSSVFGDSADLGDILGRMFGGEMGGGGRSSGRSRGHDIQFELEISLEEAYSGLKKEIKFPRHEHCKKCDGSGAKSASAMKTCSACGGRGQTVVSNGFFRMAQTCGQCRGAGKVITDHCPECSGRGVTRTTRTVEVKIPAGVDNDSQLRIRGEGEVGSGGHGDLYIFIKVNEHPLFKREGMDLHFDLPVAFTKAALGGEVKIKSLKEEVIMKIPEGTQSGKTFRLRGHGMPDVHGRTSEHGDLYVRVMVAVPTHLSARQRELLEEFAKESGETGSNGKSFKEKIKKAFR